jgi:Family of unknown function (DUF5670)
VPELDASIRTKIRTSHELYCSDLSRRPSYCGTTSHGSNANRCKDSAVEKLPRGFTISGAHIAEVEMHMLWTIFVILVVLWLLGFSLHIAGGLIHLLLVVALVVLVFNLITGRRGIV